ncbi:MAG: caspase family protein [Candidatus Bathyarchaeia archaeon]
MRHKALLSILLTVTFLSLLVCYVQAQPEFQSKGMLPIEQYESLVQQKGYATGVVSQPPPATDRWAVIIGISDYYGTANDLQYCDDDAKDFYNALVNKYGYLADHITMLIDSQATKANILAAISWLRSNEGPGDEVIFFYSGHGTYSTYDVDGDGEKRDECIIPWECSSSYLIWDGNLKAEFSTFESTRILFYFDSCYAGGMTDLAGTGRLICMACKETQTSLESSTWKNGQFTYYFVDQGMLAGKADANNDGVVTCEEAFDYAKARCSRQTPTISDAFTNDMLL